MPRCVSLSSFLDFVAAGSRVLYLEELETHSEAEFLNTVDHFQPPDIDSAATTVMKIPNLYKIYGRSR